MARAVLAIETSGRWCSAALIRGDECFARRTEVGNAHSTHLLDMVRAVLDDSSTRLAGCAAVAFGAGPGSFTGLRIACAAAQGLAYGAGLPVAPVSTLDALASRAAKALPTSARALLVAQDARMGEIYWSLHDADGIALTAPRLGSPKALRADLGGGAPVAYGCGDAWAVHGEALRGLVGTVIDAGPPDALEVARLGRQMLRAGRVMDPADVAPLYVRNDVAETTARRAARTRAAGASAS